VISNSVRIQWKFFKLTKPSDNDTDCSLGRLYRKYSYFGKLKSDELEIRSILRQPRSLKEPTNYFGLFEYLWLSSMLQIYSDLLVSSPKLFSVIYTNLTQPPSSVTLPQLQTRLQLSRRLVSCFKNLCNHLNVGHLC
jgi:hypothetical protein